MSAENNNKPVEKIRVGGVSIAIWKNDGEDGTYYKAGKPELRYQDKEGNWRDGKSYGRRDLYNLAKAALLADSKLSELNFKAKGEGEERSDADEDEVRDEIAF